MISEEKSKLSPRNRIIYAAVTLIRGSDNISDVTVRKIAKEADVGIGLINYHFQTKERLINESVQFFMGNEIVTKWGETMLGSERDPVSALKIMLLDAANFLASYPRISRLSILYDQANPAEDDNTMRAVRGIVPVIREIMGRKGKEKEAERIASICIAQMHNFFLREKVLIAMTGLSFKSEEDRNTFIDYIVERIVIQK